MSGLNQFQFRRLLFHIILLYFVLAIIRINGFHQSGVVSHHHRLHSSSLVFTRQRQKSTKEETSSFLKIPAVSLVPPPAVHHTNTVTTTTTRRRGKNEVISFQKSALFSTTISTTEDDNINHKRLGFFAKLRWLVLFPIRLLILNPLHMTLDLFAEAIVEDLDADGTTATIDDDGKSTLTTPKTTTPDTVFESSSSSSSSSTEATTIDVLESTTSATTMEPTLVETGEKKEEIISGIAKSSSSSIAVDVTPTNSRTTTTTKQKKQAAASKPLGDRWAVCSEGIDLSGKWECIVNDEFKTEYDRYLASLGQPLIVRTVAVNIVHKTTEDITQKDDGKYIFIRGTNVRGIWDRVLIASGTEVGGAEDYTPVQVPVMTADSEKVEAEAWWEDEGKVHVSWLRGVKKYGGGAFESLRYIEKDVETDEDIYVCESTFHPTPDNPSLKNSSSLVWRFRRLPSN